MHTEVSVAERVIRIQTLAWPGGLGAGSVREDLKQGETLVLGGHSECRVVGTMARSRERRSRDVQGQVGWGPGLSLVGMEQRQGPEQKTLPVW
jgi:hypothetical protein